MKKLPHNFKFKIGEWRVICDVCGGQFYASETKKRWDNLIVCKDDWEPQHDADFIRASRDRNDVPYSRPDNSEDTLCDLYNSRAYAGIGVAGCMRAGWEGAPL